MSATVNQFTVADNVKSPPRKRPRPIRPKLARYSSTRIYRDTYAQSASLPPHSLPPHALQVRPPRRRRWRPRRRPFLSLLRPAVEAPTAPLPLPPPAGVEAPTAAADPAQGVEPSFFSLRSMVDLVPLTLAPLQIPDDGGEQRVTGAPPRTVASSGVADPRRGVVSLPPNRRRRRSGGRGAHPGPSSPSGGAAGWSCGGSNRRRWIDGGGGI